MEKGGCICCVVSTIVAIIGIVVLILYFTLGSGDNGGNNITIDGVMGTTISYKKPFRGESTSWIVLGIFMSTGKPSWQWVS